jgi:hypothetical protein
MDFRREETAAATSLVIMATTRDCNNNAEVKQTITLLVGKLCHSEHDVGRVNTTICSNYIQNAMRPTYASRSLLPVSCTS